MVERLSVRPVFSLVVRNFVRNVKFRLNNFEHLAGVRAVSNLVEQIGIEPTTFTLPA